MPVVLALLVVMAACAEPDDLTDCERSIRCSVPATPSIPQPDDDELTDSFERYSGLSIPDSATDVDITAGHNEVNELYYQVSFTVDRDDLDEFCAFANDLNVRESPGMPDGETRDNFDIPDDADTVDGHVACRQAHPDNGRVQRYVMALFPDEQTASVYVNVVKWPRD